MGFGFRNSFPWLAIVLLLSTVAVAEPGHDKFRIRVLINNGARLSASVLGRAEAEAGEIFRAAEIHVDWVECQRDPLNERACTRPPGANQFVVHLVPTGPPSNDSVFGVAFLGENGTGKYCNVFLDRIEDGNNNFGKAMPEVLGTVMAHELGHLLLGSQAHSSEGLMRPIWDARGLAGIGMGQFLFTRSQSLRIKERFRKEEDVPTNRLDEGN